MNPAGVCFNLTLSTEICFIFQPLKFIVCNQFIAHSIWQNYALNYRNLCSLRDIRILIIILQGEKFIQNTSSKPYQISFDHRPEYLYVYVSGEHDSYEISRRYWLEVASECKESGYKKVLIEEDIKETISMAEAFQFAAELPTLGFRGVRVAFCDRYAEHQELNEFGEVVATNRGLFAKVFNDFTAAENWLLNR